MALKTAKQVIKVADQLDLTADDARNRLEDLIAQNKISSREARRAANKIQKLRDNATDMALRAIDLVVSGLTISQTELLSTIRDVRAELEKIKNIQKFIELISDIVLLSATTATGKPGPILAAFKEVVNDLK